MKSRFLVSSGPVLCLCERPLGGSPLTFQPGEFQARRSTLALRLLWWEYFSLAQPLRTFFFGGGGGGIRDYTSKSAYPLKVCVVYLCAAEFPQSLSVTRLALAPKTRCSAHFLAQSWPKGGLFKARIHQSSTTAVKSFSCHNVNIVCLWTTWQRIYKARQNNCHTFVKVIQIPN